jgi:hypothetical protein
MPQYSFTLYVFNDNRFISILHYITLSTNALPITAHTNVLHSFQNGSIPSACIIWYTLGFVNFFICILNFNTYFKLYIFKTVFYIGTLVHKLLYFLVCNALPWGWPREWPKHVGGILRLSHIFIHLSAFVSFSYHYLIALSTITDHLKSINAVLVTRTQRFFLVEVLRWKSNVLALLYCRSVRVTE